MTQSLPTKEKKKLNKSYNILQLEASQLEYYLSTKLKNSKPSLVQVSCSSIYRVTAVASTKGFWLYESHLA